MSEENNESNEAGFSADYVKQLRDENASWRRKVRDLENAKVETDVALEFAKRGVQADPKWLKIPDGMSATEAVETFLASFPVNTPVNNEEAAPPPRQNPPQPLAPTPTKANTPGPPAQGVYGGRTLDEIKKDPSARSKLRDQYRDMLRGEQNDNYFS